MRKGSDVIRVVVREALLSPFFAMYGLVVLLRVTTAIVRSTPSSRRALARELTCGNCRTRNATADRWSCRSCGSVALGHAALCKCGAAFSHFPCKGCGVSIWMDRP